jgi:hypothetical protein
MMALSDDTKRNLEDKLGYSSGKEVGEFLDIIDVLSGTEVGYLDGVTAGTATASKAVVLDANKAIATITTATIANFAGAENHAGVITPTGGIDAAGGFTARPRNCHTGGVPAQTTGFGTNATTNTAGTVYLSEVFVPCNISVTGVAVFNGTAVAGNGKVILYDSAGARVAISATTAMTGATAYQLIPFTGGPIAVVGPATYFIGTIYDTTTHDLRGHTIGSFAVGEDTGNTYATDSTFATVTVPTTFGGTTGPVASLY